MPKQKSQLTTPHHFAYRLMSKLGMVFALVILLGATQALADFADVTGDHWALTYVNELARREIVKGYDGNLFMPEKTISRGEATKIALGAVGKGVREIKVSSFPDVESSNALLPYIESAKVAGYVSGYSDGTFRPDMPVTRAEFLKIFLTTTDIVLENPSQEKAFKDVASKDWPAKYIYSAAQFGLVGGNGGEFNPHRGITRAESAKVIYKYLQLKDEWDRFPKHSIEELELVRWINEDRAGHSLPSLILDPEVSVIARGHSKDLGESGKRVDHIGSDGSSAMDRMQRSNVEYLAVGENVGWGTYHSRSVLDTLKAVHNAMMAEEPNQHNHRANILSTYSDYTHIGVGVQVNTEKKEVIVTGKFIVKP